MEIVRAKRLMLRDFEEEDWTSVQRYACDPEVVRYMDWGPNTGEASREFVQRAIAGQKERPRRDYTLAIVLERQGKLIGGCGVRMHACIKAGKTGGMDRLLSQP